MTIQYQSNLDSVTNNTLPPSWTAVVGAFVAQTAANGARPVSGTQASLTQASDGNIALLTGPGAFATADWQSSHVVDIVSSDVSVNHHLLRADATFANGYRVAIVYSGGNYTAVLIKRVSGADTNLGSGTGTPTPLAVANGDIVLMDTTISGSTINLYMWKSTGSKPATPNYTWTDSSITAAGYVGLWASPGTTGAGPSSDDFVLDDMQAAGSGTNGTATGATLTGTSSLSAGTASGGAAAGTLTTLPHYRNNTALRANETGVTLNIYNPTTGALVLQAAGLTTDANGKATVQNAALVTGTSYAYETVFSSDSTRRLPTGTAT